MPRATVRSSVDHVAIIRQLGRIARGRNQTLYRTGELVDRLDKRREYRVNIVSSVRLRKLYRIGRRLDRRIYRRVRKRARISHYFPPNIILNMGLPWIESRVGP